MNIDILRPEMLTGAQQARWSELQALGGPRLDSPFLGPAWPRAVAQAQGGEASGVRVAVLSEGGREVGFLPAKVRQHTGGAAGAPMCDYQALVAEPGVRVDAKRMVQALGLQRLDFSYMLEEDATFTAFARGRRFSYLVDLGQGYAAYEAERRAAGAGTLKDADKKRRKAAREVGEPVFTALSRSSAAFDQLIAWKREQFRATGQIDIFETEWTLRLLRDLFETRDPDFGGALYTLHFGDQLAAVHFHLRGRHTVHAWFIGHNPDFERYSPGIQLFQDILRSMDQTPYSRLDLGYGDYRFKRELSNAGQWVTQGFVGGASPAVLMRKAAYGVCRAAEALPLGAASELPAKAMRRLDLWRSLR